MKGRTSTIFIRAILLTVIISGISCNGDEGSNTSGLDSAQMHQSIPPSPPLSIEESINSFQIDDGIEIQVVASEPQVSSPVALDFDNKGRIWVVELNGYMPDIEGNGEEIPNGNIKILDDIDNDGTVDKVSVFADSLVLPRAIRLVYGGVLYAVPPNLYFSEIENDKPVNTIVVDATYAVGGNVEHQPNALMIGMDNWIYNAKSTRRYKRNREKKWIIQNTEFRGQWGMTMDDYGRIYYNDNSNQLRGDLYPPNQIRGSGLGNAPGIGVQIVKDQKVYPIRTNTGINRGYQPHMLDDSLRLTRFTAASGPVIYRGNALTDKYYGKAFVPEPAGNLIKMNSLIATDSGIVGEQTYKNREFMASTDERFRPVNMYNGPDGALYIVDMYRGVIQHKTYVTDYLRSEVERRALELPINMGRIYKLYSKKPEVKFNNLNLLTSEELVENFYSKNGWLRDRSQQILIARGDELIRSELIKLIDKNKEPKVLLHALWTLEGLSMLDLEIVKKCLANKSTLVKVHGLRLAERIISDNNSEYFLNKTGEFSYKTNFNQELLIQSIALLGKLLEFHPRETMEILHYLYEKHEAYPIITDLLAAVLKDHRLEYVRLYGEDSLIVNRLSDLLLNENKPLLNSETAVSGERIYQSICAQCHGNGGEGIKSLGPPLIDSEWISGSNERLIKVLLYGLTGPLEVNGKAYDIPEISGLMPGLVLNKSIDDKNIADLINYLRLSFAREQSHIQKEDVRAVRKKFPDKKTPFQATDLQ